MDTDPGKEEKDYVWDHFKLNADQRLKAFNFFVVLSVFAIGGVIAAVGKPRVLLLIGVFIFLIAVVFSLMDQRSKSLLALSMPSLKEYEKRFPQRAWLFANDKAKFARYTVAFRILFIAQFTLGVGVIIYAATEICP
jgi:hypothetical protein